MILYDWKCKRGHGFEELTSPTMKELDCPTCGETATRLVSAPRALLDGCSGDFPGAAQKWERQHQAKNYED